MRQLRYPRRWRVANVTLLLAVLFATLAPAVWLWGVSDPKKLWLFASDKWLHAMTFAVLALWFAGQYRRNSYWRIALGLLLFGLVIEACQRLVGYRSADWSDVLANCAGIGVGLLLATAGGGGWAWRVESWLGGSTTSG